MALLMALAEAGAQFSAMLVCVVLASAIVPASHGRGIELSLRTAADVDQSLVPIGPEQYTVMVEILHEMNFRDAFIIRDYYPEQWELEVFDAELGKRNIARTTMWFSTAMLSEDYISILRTKVRSILVDGEKTTIRLAVILLTSASVTSAILSDIRDGVSYRLHHTFIVSSRVSVIDVQASIVEEMRTLVIRDHWKGGLLPAEEHMPDIMHTYDILCNQCDAASQGQLAFTNTFRFQPSRGFVRLPVFLLRHEVFRNMLGRKFRVPTIRRSPWFRFDVMPDNGSLTDLKGRDYQVLELLAEAANFTFELFVSPLTSIGDGKNTESGIVGALGRREPGYNFFVVDTTRTYFRNRACQFTSYALFEDVGAWATPIPKLKESGAILSKDTPMPDVLLVALMACLGVTCFWVFSRLEARLHENRRSWSIGFIAVSCAGFVTGQSDVSKPFPSWHATRVFVGIFLFYCYFIQQIISGNLYAFLANPGIEPPMKTTDAVIKNLQTKRVKALVVQGSSFHGLIESADNTGPWAQIYAAMRAQTSGYLVQSVEEGLTNVTRSRGSSPQKVFLTSRKNLDFFYANTKKNNGGEAVFYVSPKILFAGYKAIAMRWGAPYRDAFDKKLLQLQSGGILQKLEEDALETPIDDVGEAEEAQTIDRITESARGLSDGIDDGGDLKGFSLRGLSAAFYVLFGGLSLAFVALIGEHAVHHARTRALREIRTVLDD